MANLQTLSDDELASMFRKADVMAQQGDARAQEDARAFANEVRRRKAGAQAQPESAPRRIGESSGQGLAQQFASGMTEGLTRNIVGPIVDLAQGAVNLPKRAYDYATGQEYDPMLEGSVGSTDWWDDTLQTEIPDIPLPFTDNVIAGGAVVSPDPNSGGGRFARRAGEFSGTALGTIATGGAGGRVVPRAPAASGPASVGRSVVQSMDDSLTKAPVKTLLAETLAGTTGAAGGTVGGSAGEHVADRLGLDPETGRAVGEMVGELTGGLGGAVTADLGGKSLRGMFRDPESAARYAAATRAGVRPTAGLVGNRNAAYLENAATLNPLAGKHVREAQRGQVEGTARLRDDTTDSMRANTGALPADTPYAAGTQIRDAGTSAIDRINRKLGDLTEKELISLGGERSPVSVTNIRDMIKTESARIDPAGQRVLSDRAKDLDQMRVTGTEQIGQFNVPKGSPVDPNLDAQIRTRIKTKSATLDRLSKKKNPTPTEKRQMRTLRTGIARDIQQIDANLGVPAQQLNAWRMRLGKDTDTSQRVDANVARNLYGATRNDQRVTAAREGKLPEFEATVTEKNRLAGDTALEEGGDLAFFKKLTTQGGGEPREPASVYDFLTKKDAAGRIQRYKANVPKAEFDTSMGNMIDLLGRPTSQSSRGADMNTNTFSPRVFMTNWRNLPQETRDAIFSSADIEGRMKDLETLSEALSARGTASNPSGTAAMAITAKIFSDFGPRNVALNIATLGANSALAKGFMSERVARAIAGVNPTLAEDLLTLFPARGAGAIQTETSQ